jgi:hypothetical protein
MWTERAASTFPVLGTSDLPQEVRSITQINPAPATMVDLILIVSDSKCFF